LQAVLTHRPLCRLLSLDPAEIHVKRNSNATTPQLKNEAMSLRELGIVNESCLFVGLGATLGADEYLIKVRVCAHVCSCVCGRVCVWLHVDVPLLPDGVVVVGSGDDDVCVAFRAQVYRYDPTPKPVFTFLSQMPVAASLRLVFVVVVVVVHDPCPRACTC
jgi:hypothetical protein